MNKVKNLKIKIKVILSNKNSKNKKVNKLYRKFKNN